MTDQAQPAESADSLNKRAVGEAGAERLTLGVIWAYSVPRIAFGIMGLLSSIYLMKFSTDVLLIAPAAMGILYAVSRLWDAVSDPLAGFLSDRTLSTLGRRRSWMFLAAVPMGITLLMISGWTFSPCNILLKRFRAKSATGCDP